MRKHITTAVLVAALTAVPVVGFAATSDKAAPEPAAKHASANAAAMHATRGVVKSVDATTLVITRAVKKGSEMRFTLTPSTHRHGAVAVGTPVSVRYRKDGKTDVATAVPAHQIKLQAVHAASPQR